MAKTDSHIFRDVSRTAVEQMKTDLRALGATVRGGDTCEIEHRGVRGSMIYSESEQRLEIVIVNKPFYVSSSMVESLLKRAMRRYVETDADGTT
jgi:hypothetical protein